MFIKSMVIDGFKSYGQRTDINGFDPLFNAITGLNGSGKSNILDAICFLLGITNLSQVRANNLQELVYKNGQAGINKASVSMTFDNTEKQRSPLGYEQYDELTVTRQIVIGGRNKYLINGCNASNTRVQDLFRSVQLNVNNPHFLIMQGRITKVLNMKPPEILSMLEEAAGTRMYESKKLAAQKTIEKKDSKLKEIDSVLNEEITPTLTKLKAERQTYVDYTKIVRELEHLKKIYIAWQFTQTQELSLKSKENMKSIKNTIAVRQEHTQEIKEKIKQLDAQIKEMEMKKDEESGGNLAVLEDRLKELQMTETKITSQLSVKKDVFKEETKKMKELQKNSEEDKLSVASKEKELQNLCLQLKSLEEASHKDSEDVIVAQKHFQAVSAGLSSNAEGEAATLADQLITAKSDISQAETETKQAEMKLKHAKEEIVKKKRECSSTSDSYMKDEALYHELEKVVAKLQVEIKRLNFDEGKEEKLIHERRQLLKEVDQLKYKIDTLSSMIPNLTFNYSDPEKNFDRRKVHGLVCQLIKVKDPSTSRALEVTAGGKMYNVVVDTEVTAKKILEKGQLRRRYTIIPLNKIIGRTIDGATVQKAERLVGCENVHTALSLVGYEKEVESAMQYVFGGSFVCTDMNRAKEVTFGKGIMTKAVTLDGEVFDPAGTLSGGAMPQSGSILLQLSQIKETESDLHEKQQLLKKLDQEILKMKSVSERYHALKLQYELKERELELLKTRLQQSTHHQQLEEVKALQQSIEEQEAAVTKCIDMKKKAQERVQELQSMITNSKSIRERELKAAEKSLNDSKKRAEASKKQTKEIKQLVDSLNLETSEIQKGMLHYEEQLKTIQDSLANHETNIKEFSNQLTDIKASVANAIQEVQTHKALLKAQSVQIVKLQNEMESLMKDQNNTKLQIQQLEYDVSKCEKECKDALLKVEDFLSTYRWIKEEKKFFGAPNTDYDFSTNDPKDAARRIKKLEESKAKLSKNVNMRAQNMMSKAEDQYQDLLRKKRIVENDKAKIASVIRELDEKKNLALKDAWEKVNKDFGSIFKTLLPGTKARLVPPEGMTVLEGLEFRVAFGDIWKESLSELSGGQRSLVALSLILALLLFKPAPIYILDEVDAALDISHTQNIGQMLRAHFKHSQFIIVSLKDGMFNNANVLFKTKFVDGMSTVSHHSQLKSSAAGTSRGVKSS